MLKQLRKSSLCSRYWRLNCKCKSSSDTMSRAYSDSLKAILMAEYRMILKDQFRRKKKK